MTDVEAAPPSKYSRSEILQVVAIAIATLSLLTSIVIACWSNTTLRLARAAAQFTITNPADNARVGPTEIVSGLTPFPDLAHYIVITPEEGGYWIQEKTGVDNNGVWTGTAHFGTGSVGLNQRFIVRGLATRDGDIKAGRRQTLPQDAVLSRAIVVTRVH